MRLPYRCADKYWNVAVGAGLVLVIVRIEGDQVGPEIPLLGLAGLAGRVTAAFGTKLDHQFRICLDVVIPRGMGIGPPQRGDKQLVFSQGQMNQGNASQLARFCACGGDEANGKIAPRESLEQPSPAGLVHPHIDAGEGLENKMGQAFRSVRRRLQVFPTSFDVIVLDHGGLVCVDVSERQEVCHS